MKTNSLSPVVCSTRESATVSVRVVAEELLPVNLIAPAEESPAVGEWLKRLLADARAWKKENTGREQAA